MENNNKQLRTPNLPRLSGVDFSSSSKFRDKMGRDYIYGHYYFRDLKKVFDTCIGKMGGGVQVFDIGCGNKPFEAYIRSLTKNESPEAYRGCDVVQSSEQKVDIICEASNIPEKSALYDVVICTQVIEHVFDHAKVFAEAYRLLKPGGIFIVSSNFMWEIHEAPYDFYRFTKYGFQKLLEDAGFKVKEAINNGGTYAALGQLILHVVGYGFKPSKNLLTYCVRLLQRGIALFCNTLFPFLDDRSKDERYTLNYIFVGEK